MKKITTCLFICLSALAFAQKKQLTLKESVTQQYRAFAADKMSMFQWIPNTTDYTYLEGFTVLKKVNVKGGTADVLMTIE